jgi:hypothetical protein
MSSSEREAIVPSPIVCPIYVCKVFCYDATMVQHVMAVRMYTETERGRMYTHVARRGGTATKLTV